MPVIKRIHTTANDVSHMQPYYRIQISFFLSSFYRMCAFVNITCFAYAIIISILCPNVNYLLLHTHTFVRISRCYMLFFPHFSLLFCLFLLFILHLTHLQIYSIINSYNYFTFVTVQLLF